VTISQKPAPSKGIYLTAAPAARKSRTVLGAKLGRTPLENNKLLPPLANSMAWRP
jgi:hypothetical protein